MSAKATYDYAIRLLSKRDYSRYKLSQKLKQRSFAPEEIEETLERLIEQNYLREEEYKRMRVKSLLLKGTSNQLIQRKLEQEQLEVDSDMIDQMRTENDLGKSEVITALIEKKLRGKSIPETFEEKMKLKNKLFNFLISKGHSYQDIKEYVDARFSER